MDITSRREMMERTLQDFRNWSPFGKNQYYERNPNNPQEIRVFTPIYNVFANKYTMSITPYHVAEPTPEMKPYHPRIGTAMATMQPDTERGFY